MQPLPADVLARRQTIPVKPAAVTLRSPIATLSPLDLDRELDALFAASSGAAYGGHPAYDSDERIWRYMFAGPFADAAALRGFLEPQDRAPDGRPFTVRRADGLVVGILNMLASQPMHLKVELGSIWYSPCAQRAGISRAATELALAHCFGLGYRRVEWKCNAANERSRRAATSYGFTFEGVQDAHFIIKGCNRDTAWYRMLDRDWAARAAMG